MGQVIDIFSRQGLGNDFSGASDSYEGQLIEYDPGMPIALELLCRSQQIHTLRRLLGASQLG
jgi:hypothetical protein